MATSDVDSDLSDDVKTFDSVTNLSDDVKAFRSKVIAYLMTPGPEGEGLDTFPDVSARLDELLEEACQELLANKFKPFEVTINTVHVQSWRTIVNYMHRDGKY